MQSEKTIPVSQTISTAARLCFAMIAIVVIASNTGCYRRSVAPELNYDQAQVDTLDAEIKKLDWK